MGIWEAEEQGVLRSSQESLAASITWTNGRFYQDSKSNQSSSPIFSSSSFHLLVSCSIFIVKICHFVNRMFLVFIFPSWSEPRDVALRLIGCSSLFRSAADRWQCLGLIGPAGPKVNQRGGESNRVILTTTSHNHFSCLGQISNTWSPWEKGSCIRSKWVSCFCCCCCFLLDPVALADLRNSALCWLLSSQGSCIWRSVSSSFSSLNSYWMYCHASLNCLFNLLVTHSLFLEQ